MPRKYGTPPVFWTGGRGSALLSLTNRAFQEGGARHRKNNMHSSRLSWVLADVRKSVELRGRLTRVFMDFASNTHPAPMEQHRKLTRDWAKFVGQTKAQERVNAICNLTAATMYRSYWTLFCDSLIP